jgi:1,4-dihydroxy-2-naphthoyl-CoA hydrolase
MEEMDIEELNRICKNTFMDLLDITFTEFTGKTISASMPVSPSKFQPAGLLHGGALLSLAESAASAGSFLLVDPAKYNVLGTDIHARHLASSKEGIVNATAELIYQDLSKHIWDVNLRDQDGRLLSISRVTNSIRERKKEGGDTQK